jgi:hypothetical protein
VQSLARISRALQHALCRSSRASAEPRACCVLQGTRADPRAGQSLGRQTASHTVPRLSENRAPGAPRRHCLIARQDPGLIESRGPAPRFGAIRTTLAGSRSSAPVPFYRRARSGCQLAPARAQRALSAKGDSSAGFPRCWTSSGAAGGTSSGAASHASRAARTVPPTARPSGPAGHGCDTRVTSLLTVDTTEASVYLEASGDTYTQFQRNIGQLPAMGATRPRPSPGPASTSGCSAAAS